MAAAACIDLRKEVEMDSIHSVVEVMECKGLSSASVVEEGVEGVPADQTGTERIIPAYRTDRHKGHVVVGWYHHTD